MYIGPPITDPDILPSLPEAYRALLRQTNGYVAYHGGLHVRGACVEPTWHSLRAAWEGPAAVHGLYPVVEPTDVPFAEDAMGDQYLLRSDQVYRLSAETAGLEPLGLGLPEFDTAVRADPVEFLRLQPLEQFRSDGGVLAPGQLLNVYPPFCNDVGVSTRSMRGIDAIDQRRFLAALAAQLRGVADGTAVQFRFDDPAG